MLNLGLDALYSITINIQIKTKTSFKLSRILNKYFYWGLLIFYKNWDKVINPLFLFRKLVFAHHLTFKKHIPRLQRNIIHIACAYRKQVTQWLLSFNCPYSDISISISTKWVLLKLPENTLSNQSKNFQQYVH